MDYPKSKAAELRLVGNKFADRAGAVPGSIIPAEDWANNITDELIALIQSAGLTEDEATLTQARDAVKILARGSAIGFRAKPQNPASLSLDVEAGAFFNATTGLMVSQAGQVVGPIAAPAGNPRRDIVYIDAQTGAAGIATGAEAAAPADPAIQPGRLPVLRINAYVGMTEIAAADIDELRYLSGAGLDAARLGLVQTWTAGQAGEVTALADAASIALDLKLSNNFSVTLGGNRTLANPTNAAPGQSGVIAVTQDATGSRTLSFDTQYRFVGGSAPVLTTTANAEDGLYYYVKAAGEIWISSALDWS